MARAIAAVVASAVRRASCSGPAGVETRTATTRGSFATLAFSAGDSPRTLASTFAFSRPHTDASNTWRDVFCSSRSVARTASHAGASPHRSLVTSAASLDQIEQRVQLGFAPRSQHAVLGDGRRRPAEGHGSRGLRDGERGAGPARSRRSPGPRPQRAQARAFARADCRRRRERRRARCRGASCATRRAL